jgi:signal transduction histidine kinase
MRFLAGVRHDLRTPINGIVGYSGMMIEDAVELGQADLAGELEAVRAGGMELLRHVEALLAQDRLEAMTEIRSGDIGLELRRATAEPLRRVITEAERLLRGAAASGSGATADDLGKVRDCARQFEALVARLSEGSEVARS